MKTELFASIIGAFITVLAAGFFSNIILGTNSTPVIIASTGASAMLVFGLPYAEVSKPWNLIGGHIVSAIVGISCYKFIPYELLSTSIAIPLAMTFMYLLKCMHPPGGATAITAIIGGTTIHNLGYYFIIMPIFFNSLILLLIAMAVASFRDTNPFLQQ